MVLNAPTAIQHIQSSWVLSVLQPANHCINAMTVKNLSTISNVIEKLYWAASVLFTLFLSFQLQNDAEWKSLLCIWLLLFMYPVLQKKIKCINVNVETDGNYLIDFRYSNGSGPWNTDNKWAIRNLYNGSTYIGSLVFPQQGAGEWSDWGNSNSYVVPLKKELNQLRLVFEEWNSNMNVEVNRAMLDYMRCIKL